MQWLMLQQKEPEDYVIATGRMESVRNFIQMTAHKLGWGTFEKAILWEGSGLNEVGRRADNGEIIIRIDPSYFRPAEVEELLGDPTYAKKKLGWEPQISLENLIDEMIDNDLKIAKNEKLIRDNNIL